MSMIVDCRGAALFAALFRDFVQILSCRPVDIYSLFTKDDFCSYFSCGLNSKTAVGMSIWTFMTALNSEISVYSVQRPTLLNASRKVNKFYEY